MDPHHFGNLDLHPDPRPHQIKIKIRIRINLQMTSQNVLDMSLFEHFFKGLSRCLEAKVWIRNKNPKPDPSQGDKSNSDPH
jgi:hypothetical protein